MTSEVWAHIERREHLTLLRSLDWRTLTSSQLVRIVAIIREHESEEIG